jgi:hypothetical protein
MPIAFWNFLDGGLRGGAEIASRTPLNQPAYTGGPAGLDLLVVLHALLSVL